jgi:RNA polymerase sigma-70 factor, ECF subfamily
MDSLIANPPFGRPGGYGALVTADPAVFEEHRAHLLRVAYRVTGSVADAEDAVQEAWLRWSGIDDPARSEILDDRAWLTTVVGRIGLDRLRSATARRERYVGPWLPEPLVTSSADEPLAAVVQDESVRMAAMVVLEQLSPPQRVSLVLHEALDLPFAEIADVLGCSEAAARQHASRARKVVADAAPPPRASAAVQQSTLAAFADALGRADHAALVAVLHPGAVLVSDGGGIVRAARRPVEGADKVARLLVGLMATYGADLAAGWTPVFVNGDIGFRTPPVRDAAETVVAIAVRDGRIAGIYQILNPTKLHP